jgi:hypothetical protein
MASLSKVHEKLQRATELRDEFERGILRYYESNPVGLLVVKTPDSQLASIMRPDVPADLALIAGDVLQCLRSSLDYLVWELAGESAHKQNQFPICIVESEYKNEVGKRKRLDGVPAKAAALIDAYQPYHLPEDERDSATLTMLDRLTNINKHRRVILTHLEKTTHPTDPLPFPHLTSDVVGIGDDGSRRVFETHSFYIAFNELPVAGQEIGTALDLFGNFIGHELLPQFQPFFE